MDGNPSGSAPMTEPQTVGGRTMARVASLVLVLTVLVAALAALGSPAPAAARQQRGPKTLETGLLPAAGPEAAAAAAGRLSAKDRYIVVTKNNVRDPLSVISAAGPGANGASSVVATH